MKKKKLLVGLLAAGAVIALASCGGNDPKPVDPTTQTATAKNLGQKVKVTFMNVDPDDATKKEEKEVTLDKVDASTNTAYGTVEAPKPTNAYKTFAGWFSDAELKNAANVTAITGESTFYAKWTPIYEEVKAGIGENDGLTPMTAVQELAGVTGQTPITKDLTIGNITLVANTKARFDVKNGSNVFNTQGTSIKIVLSGDEKTNSIHGDGLWASGDGKKGRIYLYKTDAEGKKVGDALEQTEEYSKDTGKLDVSFTWSDLEKGTYVIECEYSIQYKNLFTVETKEKSAPDSLVLEQGAISDYLLGSTFDTTGMVLKIKYKNLSTTTVDKDNIVIDSSAVNFNEPGEYTVSYTVKDSTLPAVTQKVRVYAVESLEVQDHILDKNRVTQNLEQLFVKDDTFSSKNLGVKAKAAVTIDGNKVEKYFDLKTNQFTVVAPALTETGEKDVTVKLASDETKTTTYKVLVVEKKLVANENTVQVAVDPVATTLGVSTDDSSATVKTINQAMQLLKASELKETVNKLVTVKPGTYNEKVEVSVPNVFMINSTAITGNVITLNERATGDNKVIIVHKQLSGDLDVNGVAHSTDGSATFSVRSSAHGFAAAGLTFQNYYNNNTLYKEAKALTSATQAVALLVEADETFFASCDISSYHDTLYAREGRQLYYNCYIEGRTDYIFGDRDVTAYFNHCTIHTLGADQDKNGGYVACNKGSKVNFGYIFDACTFEADQATEDGKGVANATVSLGRTWDEGMRVVIMNSTISAAYAKADFKGTTEGGKNTRYTEMNSGKSPSKDKIFEFNNTGDGALTATEASGYTYVSVLAEIGDEQKAFVSNKLADIFSNNGTKTWGATFVPGYLAVPVGNNPLYTVAEINLTPAIVAIFLEGSVKTTINAVDGYVTLDWVKNYLAGFTDSNVEGAYSDQQLTQAFDFTQKLVATQAIYVKLASKETVPAVTYNAGSLTKGDVTQATLWGGDDSIVKAYGTSDRKMTVEVLAEASQKDITNVSGETVKATSRLKYNGTTNASGRWVEIDLRAFTGKAKVTLFALAGGDGERSLVIKADSWDGTEIYTTGALDKSEITPKTAELACGKVYYVICVGNGVNIYGMNIEPVAEAKQVTAKTYNFDALTVSDSITEGAKIGGADSIVSFSCSSSNIVKVSANAKKYTDVTGTEVTSVNRFQMNGAGKADRYIEIDLTGFTGKAKIEFFAAAGGSGDRQVIVNEASWNGTEKYNSGNIDSSTVSKHTVTLDCGKKYYIVSGGNGCNFYAINISPVAENA